MDREDLVSVVTEQVEQENRHLNIVDDDVRAIDGFVDAQVKIGLGEEGLSKSRGFK